MNSRREGENKQHSDNIRYTTVSVLFFFFQVCKSVDGDYSNTQHFELRLSV